jgi:hypothetical protein
MSREGIAFRLGRGGARAVYTGAGPETDPIRQRRAHWISSARFSFAGRHQSTPVSLRVLFYPEAPRPEAVLTSVCAARGYEILSGRTTRADVSIFWTTSTLRRPDAWLTALGSRRSILNLACRNIGKRRVDRAFREAFGYGTLLDPRTHEGLCVQKSNLNAQHDGVVRRCPVRAVERRFVYQRLIDNVSRGRAVDYRTPVVGGRIPMAYVVTRRLDARFGDTTGVRLVAPGDVYSIDEMAALRRFCSAMGLDYAELDVLRDRRDGRLFVVDANPTPWWQDGLTPGERQAAIARLAAAFERHAHAARRRSHR